LGTGEGGAGVEVGKTAADVEDVTIDGVWNCGGGRTNIDFAPPAGPFPKRGSLGSLIGAGVADCRCGDVGWGEVIDRAISGLDCCREGGASLGPGPTGDALGIREVERLGFVSGGELGVLFEGGGTGLGSSNGSITVGLGTPLECGSTLSAALLISGRSASSSFRSCRSYMIVERTCSTRAAVISS